MKMCLLISDDDICVSIPPIENKENTTTLQKIFICAAEMILNYDSKLIALIDNYWENIDENTLNKYKYSKGNKNDLCEEQCGDEGNIKQFCPFGSNFAAVSDDQEMG